MDCHTKVSWIIFWIMLFLISFKGLWRKIWERKSSWTIFGRKEKYLAIFVKGKINDVVALLVLWSTHPTHRQQASPPFAVTEKSVCCCIFVDFVFGFVCCRFGFVVFGFVCCIFGFALLALFVIHDLQAFRTTEVFFRPTNSHATFLHGIFNGRFWFSEESSCISQIGFDDEPFQNILPYHHSCQLMSAYIKWPAKVPLAKRFQRHYFMLQSLK